MESIEIKKRQEIESDFHDKKFGSHREKDFYAYGFTSIIFNNLMRRIGNVDGKKILDFGCGEGWLGKLLASQGAEVWAFDISHEAVELTKSRFNNLNFRHKIHVNQMAAENLSYDSNTFDLIVGNAILHHIDLYTGLKEIKRVLEKGGKAYFMEPLGHNPFLNLYRFITPEKRTRNETPIRFEQFSIMREFFPNFTHEEYYFTAIFALFWYFIGRNNLMLKTRDILYKLDRVILRNFKFARKYCWYSILEFEK